MKDDYLIVLAILVASFAVVAYRIIRDRRSHRKTLKKDLETIVDFAQAPIPAAVPPDTTELQETWKKELQAFAQAYITLATDVATSDNERFAYSCQDVAISSGMFWSIHARVTDGTCKDRNDSLNGLCHRIDDVRKQCENVRQEPEPDGRMEAMPRKSYLTAYAARTDELFGRLGQAQEVLVCLRQGHPTLAGEAEMSFERGKTLLCLIDQNLKRAEAWSKDGKLLGWIADDIRRDLDRAEEALKYPKELLDFGERRKEMVQLGLERYHTLRRQLALLDLFIEEDSPTEPEKAAARRLSDLSGERSEAAERQISQDGPKDWADIERRIWHAVHEAELALWVVDKRPSDT